ncbi:MAG TPA: glycosyltransferase family 2 protein [Blastocatellia bacterium]|nr:glycosyltransferase family 2 protein [Blastocatellia bacterium]
MAGTRLISIVVPAMNEEENVLPFYDAVKGVTDSLSEFDWEIIFIDDGSTDATVQRIMAVRENDPRVCVIQLSRNFGSYAAIKAGFDYARGHACISISADLQDPPELFRRFVALWQEGYHTVWGVREQRDDPWSKTLLASLFYRLVRSLALADLPDHGMDCGLFDRKVVDVFRKIRDKNSITFMTIYWMGFRQARVGYRRESRRFGTSKWPLGKRIKSALDVITAFSYLPVRLSSYLGLIISTIAFVGAIIVLFDKLVLGIGEWGWPSLMITMLFLGGVQMLMLGIIGEYMWRINTEVRDRPQYIVMHQVGIDKEP